MKKHIALIVALFMGLTVFSGIMNTDQAEAATTLKKPTLYNHAASSTSIKNTWTKVSGAKGYEVYRSTKSKSGFKKVKTVKSGKTVSWTNKKLKKNKTYYYKVRAYKTVNGKKKYGKFSSVVSAKTTAKPNLKFSMSSTSSTTSKIKVKITNKGKSSIVVNPEKYGMFYKNADAVEEFIGLPDDATYEDFMNAGAYIATASKVTIKPGKTKTITYTTIGADEESAVKVKYTKKSLVLGFFNVGKTEYTFMASNYYGSEIDKL